MIGSAKSNSKEPANTIGSVLTRRMAEVGDVVRVGRGTWGLREWYPNRSFKVKDDEKKDDKRPQGGPVVPPPPGDAEFRESRGLPPREDVMK
nr:hypothetical protein HAP40_14760 [Bradyrhizobium sp. 1(2017)]